MKLDEFLLFIAVTSASLLLAPYLLKEIPLLIIIIAISRIFYMVLNKWSNSFVEQEK